ncbi:MAG: sel1 repeat family protein [Lachnospiraceae bacterium]|nr:sel1 repeat family protein [Lachnospiraceae bacterium]
MGKALYLNYAKADRENVAPVLQKLREAGFNVQHTENGNVSGKPCVLNFPSAASRRDDSYRKVLNYALRHDLDCIQIHLERQKLLDDIEIQNGVMLAALRTVMPDKAAEVYTKALSEGASPEIPEKEEAELAAAPAAEENAEVRSGEPAAEPVRKEQGIQIPAGTDSAEFASAAMRLFESEGFAPARTSLKKNDEMYSGTSAETLFNKGLSLLSGDGGSKDEKAAFDCFRQAANAGMAKAQYELSICYDRGIGTGRNITEAARWCEMAAYGGHAQAQSDIGACYEHGQGVSRNMREAVRWYQIASEQGNIEAKNNLAFCYQKGRGVTRNSSHAIQLYSEAAEAGNSSAQYNLGFCLWYGEGVPTDKPRAVELFRKSAENGNAKAVQMLKVLNQRSYFNK